MLCADPLPVEQMYIPIKGKTGRWRTLRGTSQVESVNNRVRRAINGQNYSTATAQAMLTDIFSHVNATAAVTTGIEPVFGVRRRTALSETNLRYEQLGLQPPFSYKRPDIDVSSEEELFGFNWLSDAQSPPVQHDSWASGASCSTAGAQPGSMVRVGLHCALSCNILCEDVSVCEHSLAGFTSQAGFHMLSLYVACAVQHINCQIV